MLCERSPRENSDFGRSVTHHKLRNVIPTKIFRHYPSTCVVLRYTASRARRKQNNIASSKAHSISSMESLGSFSCHDGQRQVGTMVKMIAAHVAYVSCDLKAQSLRYSNG